jgi:hypothetical protein
MKPRFSRWCDAAKAAIVSPLFISLVVFLPSSLFAGGWAELQEAGLILKFQESDRTMAQPLLSELERSRKEVAMQLGGGDGLGMTVYLTSNENTFQEVTGGRIPHWGVGCAFPSEKTIVLRKLPGQQEALIQTARHEISHVLLHHLVDTRVPVWFNEGVAMWVSGEWRLQQSAEIFYALFAGGFVSLAEIDDVLGFPSTLASLAYTESLLAVTHLIHLGGEGAVPRMIQSLRVGGSFEDALQEVTGLSSEGFEASWKGYVSGRFSPGALMLTSHALWFYMTFLAMGVYFGIRVKNRRRLKAWEEEDPAAALPLKLRLKVSRREDSQ